MYWGASLAIAGNDDELAKSTLTTGLVHCTGMMNPPLGKACLARVLRRLYDEEGAEKLYAILLFSNSTI